MSRVQVEAGETFTTLALKIAEILKIADPSTIAMGKDPNPATAASLSQIGEKTIDSSDLK